MGKIFYLMGKSASGKDRLGAALRAHFGPRLENVILYATRPIRSGERDGEAYWFIDEAQMEAFRKAGRVIEERTYQTVHGPWTYATIDDGRIRPEEASYLITGTPESYLKTREYFGEETMVPLYIDLDNGLRLQRALSRERRQEEPKYAEMCRRFLADEQDFSEERLAELRLPRRYQNVRFRDCLRELIRTVEENL